MSVVGVRFRSVPFGSPYVMILTILLWSTKSLSSFLLAMNLIEAYNIELELMG